MRQWTYGERTLHKQTSVSATGPQPPYSVLKGGSPIPRRSPFAVRESALHSAWKASQAQRSSGRS